MSQNKKIISQKTAFKYLSNAFLWSFLRSPEAEIWRSRILHLVGNTLYSMNIWIFEILIKRLYQHNQKEICVLMNFYTGLIQPVLVINVFSWSYIKQQSRIHGIRCYETPFSAVKEKALRTYGPTNGPMDGPTDRRTDGRTDPLIEVLRST